MALKGFGRRQGKVAIAGAGAIAVVHALAAPAAKLKVTAVASKGGNSARHLAGNLNARKVAVDALPAGAQILIVATPPSTHESIALQGLKAGASVLVEKPLTDTLASADRLVEAARRASKAENPAVMRVGENLLHSPYWEVAVDRAQKMGQLTHLSARVVQAPPTWGHFLGPLTDGGVLFDLGVHPLALIMELAGSDPVGVTASLSSMREDGADDLAEVKVRFASGLVAALEVSWRGHDTAADDRGGDGGGEAHWAIQAASSAAVLRLEFSPEPFVEFNGEPITVERRHDVADPRLETLGYVDQLIDMTLAKNSCGLTVSHGQTVSRGQTVESARDVLEVACAAYASAGTGGAEVSIPFSGDRNLTPIQLWRRV